MEDFILKTVAEHGIVGAMLAWTNFMLWHFLKQGIALFKEHTSLIEKNTAVVQENTDVMKAVKKIIVYNEGISK